MNCEVIPCVCMCLFVCLFVLQRLLCIPPPLLLLLLCLLLRCWLISLEFWQAVGFWSALFVFVVSWWWRRGEKGAEEGLLRCFHVENSYCASSRRFPLVVVVPPLLVVTKHMWQLFRCVVTTVRHKDTHTDTRTIHIKLCWCRWHKKRNAKQLNHGRGNVFCVTIKSVGMINAMQQTFIHCKKEMKMKHYLTPCTFHSSNKLNGGEAKHFKLSKRWKKEQQVYIACLAANHAQPNQTNTRRALVPKDRTRYLRYLWPRLAPGGAIEWNSHLNTAPMAKDADQEESKARCSEHVRGIKCCTLPAPSTSARRPPWARHWRECFNWTQLQRAKRGRNREGNKNNGTHKTVAVGTF